MLTHLRLKNFILIDTLDLELTRGFWVITGETGSGKSILLEALALLTGQRRGDAGYIKVDQEEATLSAVFHLRSIPFELAHFLREHGLPVTEQMVIRRTISSSKSRAWINDEPITLGLLKKIGPYLLDLQEQGEVHHSAFPQKGRQWVDQIGGGDLLKTKEEVAQAYYELKQAQESLKEFQETQSQRAQKQIYYQTVLERLNALKPLKNEEEDLLRKREENTQKGQAALTLDSFIQELEPVLKTLWKLEKSPFPALESLDTLYKRFQEDCRDLEDLCETLKDLYGLYEKDQKSLETIDQRLHDLRSAAKNLHTTCDALEPLWQEAQESLASLEVSEEKEEELRTECQKAFQKYEHLCAQLTPLRQEACLKLEQAVTALLPDLKLDKAQFKMVLEKESTPHPEGLDRLTPMVCFNPGSPFTPLSETASGGELSRLCLALKSILSPSESPKVLLFDEIDTGVSGGVSQAMGRLLKRLSSIHQVLAITHSPQVAACGDHHLKVWKTQDEKQTSWGFQKLSLFKERVEEVARLLSGEKLTPEAIKAAEKLWP